MSSIVSILLPLHNEGKMIEGALKNLAGMIDDHTEVIAGLDGCSDMTAEIVRRYPFVKAVEFPCRLGKHQVINELTHVARGEIIIVHDADWILAVDGGVATIREVFEDPSVGGLSVPIGGLPHGRGGLPLATLAFRAENIVAHYLTEYQFCRCVMRLNGRWYVEDSCVCHPFMVTIYRKSAVGDMQTTADDMERALILRAKGLRVRVIGFSGRRVYFETRDTDKTFKVLFLRNLRSYVSIAVVKRVYSFSSSVRYYLSATMYCFRKTLADHPVDIVAVLLWYLVTTCACLAAKVVGLRKFSAQRLWKYRADRGHRQGA